MRSGIGNSPSDPFYVSQTVATTDANGNPIAAPTFAPSGGTSTARLVSSLGTTNATSVKNSAGTLYLVDGYNGNAAARYLKIYNKATAPTVGTDIPILTRYLAPQASFNLSIPSGVQFSAGLAYALTTGAPDNDTGAVGAGDIMAMNLVYR